MPEHIKALIAVLGLAMPVLLMSKEPLIAAGYRGADFHRHRSIWLAVTLLVFLAHSFWLSIALCAVLLYSTGTRDQLPLALYCAVLFAYPYFSQAIPGFGPIEHFFELNYIRTLNLVVLLPLALAVPRDKAPQSPLYRAPDLALLCLLGLMLVTQAPGGSLVGTVRNLFYLVVDIWIPFYVASRTVRSMRDFRIVAASFLVAALIVAFIAVFESARHWLVYDSLRAPLGVPFAQMYLLRDEGGPLRANVSFGNAIVLGYAIMVGIGMYAILYHRLRPRWKRLLAGCCLVAGLIASFSRGPWVGTATLALVMIVLGQNRWKRMTASLAAGGTICLALMISPFGQRVIDYLPFIGTVEPGSVEYRRILFDTSMQVFWENPILGNVRFMEHPAMEQLRLGHGIIDIVNTYLQVALPYGSVGLLFFLGALLLPVLYVWRARKSVLHSDVEAEHTGRALLAIMAGILVTITTVSSIGVIPTIYWLMAGLCVSYARLVAEANQVGARKRRSERPGNVNHPDGLRSASPRPRIL